MLPVGQVEHSDRCRRSDPAVQGANSTGVRLPSAATVLLSILAVVSLSEATVMWLLLPLFGGLPGTAEGLLDAALLAAISAPLLWCLVIRPFRTAARQQAVQFEKMLDNAPDGVVGVDEAGRIVLVNKRTLVLFGYSTSELLGQSIEVLVPERFRDAHVGHRRGYQEAPHSRFMGKGSGLMGRRQDGAEFPVDVALSVVPNRSRPLTLAFVRDVSDQRALWVELSAAKTQIERELREGQRFREMTELLQTTPTRDEVRSVLRLHLERLFPSMHGAVFLFSPSRDVVETLVSWGPAASSEDQFSVDECWALRLGKPYGMMNEAQDTVPCQHVGTKAGGYLCVPMLADGETLGVFHLRSAPRPDADGWLGDQASGALTEEQRQRALAATERLAPALANLRLRETLRNQSIRDPLTGLFNRRYMEESLARELNRAARHQSPVSVVMLDLDGFKRLNDVFGHDVGDGLLCAFGGLLATHLRAEDIVCRYGGEEFALILPGATSDGAVTRAEELRIECADVTVDNHGGGRVSTSFSAGVATFPEDGSTADALLKAADIALYRAKAEGRNRVVALRPTATESQAV